jgi:hypothetical protein
MCGDININYLEKCDRRQQLNVLLSSCNLMEADNFPTGIVNDSRTVFGNIYTHKTRSYTINPVMNGLSDHDA